MTKMVEDFVTNASDKTQNDDPTHRKLGCGFMVVAKSGRLNILKHYIWATGENLWDPIFCSDIQFLFDIKTEIVLLKPEVI